MHQHFIQQTYQLARRAVQNGNHPFGALLQIDGEVVLTQMNQVITSGDVTGHAELELVRKASVAFKHEELTRAVLYTSTEPCAMCSGAIFWSGIGTVVYGCSAKKLANQRNASKHWNTIYCFLNVVIN